MTADKLDQCTILLDYETPAPLRGDFAGLDVLLCEAAEHPDDFVLLPPLAAAAPVRAFIARWLSGSHAVREFLLEHVLCRIVGGLLADQLRGIPWRDAPSDAVCAGTDVALHAVAADLPMTGRWSNAPSPRDLVLVSRLPGRLLRQVGALRCVPATDSCDVKRVVLHDRPRINFGVLPPRAGRVSIDMLTALAPNE